MRAMFFCTDRHGARCALKILLQKGFEVVGCVSDEPRPSETSEICDANSILCLTTKELYDLLEKRQLPHFDIGISYLYHRILKKPIIDFEKEKIINFHPAPVSVHKGIAACCYCLLNGYDKWAVTAHYVVPEIDEGDVICEKWFSLPRGLTAFGAEEYIQERSLELFTEVIDVFSTGGFSALPRKKQDISLGHYFSRKELEQIKDVSQIASSDEIDKRIRALWFPPYHGASVMIDGKKYSLVNEELLQEIASLYKTKYN